VSPTLSRVIVGTHSAFSQQDRALSESILSATLADVELEPSSIPPDWILSGNPATRSKILGRSHDLLAHVIVWECGAVSYRWHYNQDEVYIVLSGEGFVNDEKGVEHRLGPGDVAFFPAGSSATWRHPDHFRKVAVLKESVWRPLGIGLKLWNKLLRMIGITDTSPLLGAVAPGRGGNSNAPPNQLS
jgi:uncharacterized cupin superfamily protein